MVLLSNYSVLLLRAMLDRVTESLGELVLQMCPARGGLGLYAHTLPIVTPTLLPVPFYSTVITVQSYSHPHTVSHAMSAGIDKCLYTKVLCPGSYKVHSLVTLKAIHREQVSSISFHYYLAISSIT